MKSKAIPNRGETIPTIGTKIEGNNNVFIFLMIISFL